LAGIGKSASQVARGVKAMDIRIETDLWATSMFPEGLIERWLVLDGAAVMVGDPVAKVRIADGLHEITAPASGRLTIAAARNAVVEPGSVIAQVSVANLAA
jgi:pyruvate/2-oxoglutarate dehydrogenase complex dihydrolipoamide acyltransferase (E2) component